MTPTKNRRSLAAGLALSFALMASLLPFASVLAAVPIAPSTQMGALTPPEQSSKRDPRPESGGSSWVSWG